MPVFAEKFCFDDHLDSGKEVKNCKLKVDTWVPIYAQSLTLFQLIRDDVFGEASVVNRTVIPEGQEDQM